VRIGFLFIFVMLLVGCETVSPWDRDLLAKGEMMLIDDVNEASLKDQIYFSKEASVGGASASGAGCGCN
jgi:hypothetical protein